MGDGKSVGVSPEAAAAAERERGNSKQIVIDWSGGGVEVKWPRNLAPAQVIGLIAMAKDTILQQLRQAGSGGGDSPQIMKARGRVPRND